MPETPQEVLKMIQDNNIQIIDLKFIDMPGIWQHCSFYYDQIDESSFTDGVPFDGSSIRGWKAINESDMAMVPDPTTAWIDPFYKEPTLSMICSIKEPRTGEWYSRCPRVIAGKAIEYLKSTGIGDTAFFWT
jgi:glutamine synthetase